MHFTGGSRYRSLLFSKVKVGEDAFFGTLRVIYERESFAGTLDRKNSCAVSMMVPYKLLNLRTGALLSMYLASHVHSCLSHGNLGPTTTGYYLVLRHCSVPLERDTC